MCVRGHQSRESVYVRVSPECVFVKSMCVCVCVYPSIFDFERAAASVDVSPVQSQFGLLSVLH